MPDLSSTSREIGRSLRKIQKIPPEVCTMKQEMIYVSQMVYYLYRGVVPSFRFAVLVGASQKNPISTLRKWKRYFSWDKSKIGLCGVPCHPKRHGRVRYSLVPTNYTMIKAEIARLT
jgi:hypothetical protein